MTDTSLDGCTPPEESGSQFFSLPGSDQYLDGLIASLEVE